MAGQRRLGQFERLDGAPASNQRHGERTTLAMGLRMVGAKAPQRARQQIFAGEDRFDPLVLFAQRSFERFPADDPQCDQVLADPAAAPLLARQGEPDVVFASQPSQDEEFTEEHKWHSCTISSSLSHSHNSDNK